MFGSIKKLSSLVSTTTVSNKLVKELKLLKMKINIILAYCTLCYFQCSLQSALVFILFTVNA